MNMSENFKQPLDRPDRALGDEWADWDGKASENNTEEGRGLFLFFTFAIVVLIDAAFLLLYYLTSPRLAEFHLVLPKLVLWLAIFWIFASSVLYLQLLLTVNFGRNFFFIKSQIYFLFDLVFTRVFKLSKVLRISRDRMGNSFVKVSNAVVRAVSRGIKDKKLMILLPRCLTKENLLELNSLKEKYPIEVFTVSGGELARKKVKEFCPSAIIGVACERDLVSGIRDVGSKIPVIGIPNKRPKGPCKDTVVDIGEITKAVEFYLK